ncbi:MAG: short-chain dehydrogenase/reductase [Actinomycetia bacterium]|nr:short-chain dehydrogenase/reductase [Actinomycetes bacterium]
MDPRGRVVVVTGAAGGIGAALVRGLVDGGAKAVVAVDLEAPAGDGVVLPRPLDVTDEAATAALLAEVEGAVGPVEMWFANAGLAGGGGPEVPDSTWDRQWRVNVMAHVVAARALVPGWVARGEGHLVVTASVAGLLTTLGDGVYAATKHAAVGFAEWLAITYGAEGVRVSCVCPGAVDTAMLRAGAAGDAAAASAGIGGGAVLSADEAAGRILADVVEDRFLILTHPEMHELIVRKAEDPDRWIRGMQRLWARVRS